MRYFLPACLSLVFCLPSMAATKTWTGAGTDANWGTAANWMDNTPPVANDDLVFPAAAAQQTNNNNLAFLTTFRSITVEGGTYTFTGNTFRLTNGMTVSSGTQTFNVNVTLSVAQTITTGTGATVTFLILTLINQPVTIDGTGIVGIGLISGFGNIIKSGQGIGAIIASAGYTGSITINDGIFVVDANIPSSAVTIQGTPPLGITIPALSGLGGTGTVGPTTVTSGGISAGTLTSPTGILNISGSITFTSNAGYLCKLGGTTPGANGHDQLNVTGTVTLNDALLAPLPWAGFQPAIGDTYVILSNDGSDPINGTFANLPEGASFAGPLNTAFQITYHGGDGNDVAITRVAHSPFDFDGDGLTDVAVFRPSSGTWFELLSTTGNFRGVSFGIQSDKIAPADFDGDNKADVAVFRPSDGTWYVLNSRDGTFSATPFGLDGDLPVPNDFDGDGRADFAVFRPSNGVWYELRSLGNAFVATQFGASGDVPQMGDYDGDGMGDLAVYRAGVWYFLMSSDGSFAALQYGIPSDIAAPADFDGDGTTDPAVFRDGGTWYIHQSTAGDTAFPFGIPGDRPVPGDYDGDGRADAAVYRNGAWYYLRTTSGFGAVSFGVATDIPVPGAFN